MKQRIICILLALTVLLSLSSCTGKSNSTFSIEFIDVGQGDAALVECDGKYMLIDGGDAEHGKTVYDVLKNRRNGKQQGIQHLDILVISHLHKDHYAGLTKALEYAQSVDITICNATEPHKSNDMDSSNNGNMQFEKFEERLNQIGSQITVPPIGKKYHLGSAEVEVLDNSSVDGNDSLVLLITYGDTRFLFTGDIEVNGQTRISDKYHAEYVNSYDYPSKIPFKIDLMKMPHHGAYTGSLYRFLWTFMPDYAIMSAGNHKRYKHPSEDTIKMLDKLKEMGENGDGLREYYITNRSGNIIVTSDGKELTIKTTK